VAATDGQLELVERAPEPLEQQRAASRVLLEQADAAFAAGEPQRRDLPDRRITAPRDDELQDGGLTGLEGCFRHECLGRVRIRTADGDPPVQLEAANELRKRVEPRSCPDCERLLTDDSGNLQHGKWRAVTPC